MRDIPSMFKTGTGLLLLAIIIFFITVIINVTFYFQVISPINDWVNANIINKNILYVGNYAISDYKNNTIKTLADIKTSKILLHDIVDYKIKNNYLLILTMQTDSHDAVNSSVQKINTTVGKEFWAINYETSVITGPMTEAEFYWFRRNHSLLTIYLHIPNWYWYNDKNNGLVYSKPLLSLID